MHLKTLFKKACSVIFTKIRNRIGLLYWEYRYARLPRPKVKSHVPQQDPLIIESIKSELKKNGFDLIDLKIDLTGYRQYVDAAQYHKNFPTYYDCGVKGNFAEKSLEHYVAAQLLNLSREDCYIDIANANSPTVEIYQKLYGCKVYRQDLLFPEGFHGNKIGGNAASMPVEDGFATKMALHCSFEHFEQDSDIRFIKEAGRVLRQGGKLCILPLYLFNQYVIQTDPSVLPKEGMVFERDAVLYGARNWFNRHGRFYDVEHLITRIRDNLGPLQLRLYAVENAKEVGASCHLKFAAVFEKK